MARVGVIGEMAIRQVSSEAAEGKFSGEMSDSQRADLYLEIAIESLAGAQSEYANRRYNNCANRAYYAAFQAATSALLRESIRAHDNQWAHTFVQSEFVGRLINRRHRYNSSLRGTLSRLESLRLRADYYGETISQPEASRGLRRSQELVDAIQSRGGHYQ
jgi:uncharacterized protein (UPF0332 family)